MIWENCRRRSLDETVTTRFSEDVQFVVDNMASVDSNKLSDFISKFIPTWSEWRPASCHLRLLIGCLTCDWQLITWRSCSSHSYGRWRGTKRRWTRRSWSSPTNCWTPRTPSTVWRSSTWAFDRFIDLSWFKIKWLCVNVCVLLCVFSGAVQTGL